MNGRAIRTKSNLTRSVQKVNDGEGRRMDSLRLTTDSAGLPLFRAWTAKYRDVRVVQACPESFHELWPKVAGEQTNGGSRGGASVLSAKEIDHFRREDGSVSPLCKHLETATG